MNFKQAAMNHAKWLFCLPLFYWLNFWVPDVIITELTAFAKVICLGGKWLREVPIPEQYRLRTTVYMNGSPCTAGLARTAARISAPRAVSG